MLQNVLKQDVCIHFLSVSIAIPMLDDNTSTSDPIGYASERIVLYPKLQSCMVLH